MEQFTRLTIEQSDNKVIWEIPYEDVTGSELIQALKTLMVGITFSESSFESSLADYINNNSLKYEVLERVENDNDEIIT